MIICTKNEEKYIGETIKRIKKAGRYEIIVVDKSSDNTPIIARELGARVIKQKNNGKGNAMRLGARKARGRYLVFVDGDNSYEVEKIPKMVSLLKNCGIVYGWRIFRKQKLLRLLADRLANFLVWMFHGYKTKDLLTGFFAIRRDDFLNLNTKEKGFGIETEIFMKVYNKFKICHIWTKYNNREDSKLGLKSMFEILFLIISGVK